PVGRGTLFMARPPPDRGVERSPPRLPPLLLLLGGVERSLFTGPRGADCIGVLRVRLPGCSVRDGGLIRLPPSLFAGGRGTLLFDDRGKLCRFPLPRSAPERGLLSDPVTRELLLRSAPELFVPLSGGRGMLRSFPVRGKLPRSAVVSGDFGVNAP